MHFLTNYKKHTPAEETITLEPLGHVTQRQLTAKDVTALCDVLRRNYENRLVDVTAYKYLLKKRHRVYFGYYLQEELVAVLGLWYQKDNLYIDNFVVDEPYQRLGLGEQILTRALNQTIAHPISFREKSALHVYEKNEPAKALYHKLGYRKIKTVKKFYTNGDHAFLMVAPTITQQRTE